MLLPLFLLTFGVCLMLMNVLKESTKIINSESVTTHNMFYLYFFLYSYLQKNMYTEKPPRDCAIFHALPQPIFHILVQIIFCFSEHNSISVCAMSLVSIVKPNLILALLFYFYSYISGCLSWFYYSSYSYDVGCWYIVSFQTKYIINFCLFYYVDKLS